MSFLSVPELIEQLSSHKIYDSLNTESVPSERNISPWFGKRNLLKSEKRDNDEKTFLRSQKTEQFLNKIFPNKRRSTASNSKSEINKGKTIMKQKITEAVENQQGQLFVFLPIKPKKFATTASNMKQFQITEKDKLSKKMGRTHLKLFQPQIKVKENRQLIYRNYEQHKGSPAVFTFRKMVKKNERSKTEGVQRAHNHRKKLSMQQITKLIGCEQKKVRDVTGEPNYNISKNQITKKAKTEDTMGWLMPRQFKRNIKSNRLKAFAYKSFFV